MERHCEYHPGAPAIAICTVCEEDICASCHHSALTGYAVCASCQQSVVDALATRWEQADRVRDLPYAFLHTVVAALSSPRNFFARVRPEGGWVRPLALGLICMEIGTMVGNAWAYLFVDSFGEVMKQYAEAMQTSVDQAVPMFFLNLPFVVPLVFALHLGLLHVSLKLMGARTRWSATARIVGFSSAAFILQIVPPIADFSLGHLLAIIWMFNLEINAVQQHYRMGFLRTLGAVLGPFLIVLLFSV